MKNKNVRVERRVVGYGPPYEADVCETSFASNDRNFAIVRLGYWDESSKIYRSCTVRDARYRNIKIPTI
uniref:Uncharacterized protein n=1 Tax=viral metagenome TaxID=1070528 RepID=A0A6M3Y0Q0_9ZZZZ